MLFGAAVFFATIIPAIINNEWKTAIFVIQLLFAVLIVCLLQLLTVKIPIKTIMFKYIIDVTMTLSVILLFGWFLKWYELSYVWQMFVMVIPALIIGYFLDTLKIKKDVEIINQKIKHRRDKTQKEKEKRLTLWKNH